MKEQFGVAFKAPPRPHYQRPCPNYIDRMFEFHQYFRILDFTLFSRVEKQTTLEYMARFTAQCGEVSNNDMLKLRLFSSSLIGLAFTWSVNLLDGSIQTWQDIEKVFHA